ncbi:MAG: hypothetical protein COC06_01365 [Bacteroidales bacterium]|nr:MAG: hypothetical protein COC06_01365 [Bacteroidales bacterium]
MERNVAEEEIFVDSVLKQQIAMELGKTNECVRKALKYHTHSKLARKIRRRAKDLLIDESNRIKDFE